MLQEVIRTWGRDNNPQKRLAASVIRTILHEVGEDVPIPGQIIKPPRTEKSRKQINREAFGTELKQHMLRKNISPTSLQVQMGVSKYTIVAWRVGRYTPGNSETMLEITETLHLTSEEQVSLIRHAGFTPEHLEYARVRRQQRQLDLHARGIL